MPKKYLAQRQTRALLRSLDREIKRGDLSLRELCVLTQPLDIPERLYHSTVSYILHHRPDKNLYLQQWLLLLRLLESSPEAQLLGEPAAAMAHAFNLLSPRDQRRVLRVVQQRLPRKHRKIAERLDRAEQALPD